MRWGGRNIFSIHFDYLRQEILLEHKKGENGAH